MKYCTQCGSITKKDEQYCLVCGAEIPADISERLPSNHRYHRFWFIPLIILSILLASGIGLHFYLNYQDNQALEAYNEGISYAEDGHFSQALEAFTTALSYKDNYEAAETARTFMEVAVGVEEKLSLVDEYLENNAYQEAIALTHEAEDDLDIYRGSVTQNLLDRILLIRDEVRVAQIAYDFEQNPPIEELKMQLWRLQDVRADIPEELITAMETRLINDSFSRASEKMQENQFNTALSIVEEGLRYTPESERLKNLKSTIEQHKVAFETEQQQRIEQALNQYEIEQEQNENHAIELVNVVANSVDYGTSVNGEVKSVATVPIYSATVNYSLYDEDDVLLLENETFIFPDPLYPGETGSFEFMHDDLHDSVVVKIDKISWYLEQE